MLSIKYSKVKNILLGNHLNLHIRSKIWYKLNIALLYISWLPGFCRPAVKCFSKDNSVNLTFEAVHKSRLYNSELICVISIFWRKHAQRITSKTFENWRTVAFKWCQKHENSACFSCFAFKSQNVAHIPGHFAPLWLLEFLHKCKVYN